MNAATLTVILLNAEPVAAVEDCDISDTVRILRRCGDVTMVRRPAAVATAMVDATVKCAAARREWMAALESQVCEDSWSWGSLPWHAAAKKRIAAVAAL